MKILVLDGNSILNRAFYGIKLLTTKDGQYTNAIFGFMNILLRLENDYKPDETAIAFDLKAPTFRHNMYDGYKAQRKGMPEELAAQMPVLKELLGLLGYKMVTKEGYEADDILGTLAAEGAKRGDEVLLATGDRDSLQLVCENVNVLLTTTKLGRGETNRIDTAAVMEKYGVSPKQLIDVKALMGDASDNIPGVSGIGEKTALMLIQNFKSLDGVYENIESELIKKGARQKLIDGKEAAYMSQKLAEICLDVPVTTAKGEYVTQAADEAAAAALLTRLEMHSILERLGFAAQSFAAQDFEQISFGGQSTHTKVNEIQAQQLSKKLSGKIFAAPQTDEKNKQTGKWLLLEKDTQSLYFADENDPLLLQTVTDVKNEIYAFDSKPLHKIALEAGGKAAICYDVKLAAYLLNPSSSGYNLARLCGEYGTKADFSCEEYPEAGCFWSLYEIISKKIEQSEMQTLLTDIEQPLAEVLASMEIYGIQLNAEGLKSFGKELEAEIENELKAIYEIAGGEFNVNSPKQLAEVLFEKLELPHGRKTKSGYSTDAETLEDLRGKSPIIEHILLYRSYQKLNSTYVEGLLKVIGEDGRIHSTFNQTEARTGRISSLEPNMQNIPVRTKLGSRLREFFTAGEGCVFSDADYSQIELRILAHISDDEGMKQAFLNGEDIHRATAAKVNGLPPEMVTPQLRSAAKAVNFGIVYGIGAFSLSKDIGLSVKEADAFIKSYLASFPGVEGYMNKTVEDAKQNGYVSTMFGRRRPLPELTNSNRNIQALGKRIAMNTPIQGSAADIIKIAMIAVYRRLAAEGLQSRLILQVHDELIVETCHGEETQVAKILQQEMENAAKLSIPLSAEVNTGKTWLEAKGD